MKNISLLKHNRKIICYYGEDRNGKWWACTGKPSDATSIAWSYDTEEEAKRTAEEYFHNYTKI